MFYLTGNFESQKLRLRKTKEFNNADADAEMPMPRFPNGNFCGGYSF